MGGCAPYDYAFGALMDGCAPYDRTFSTLMDGCAPYDHAFSALIVRSITKNLTKEKLGIAPVPFEQ